MTMTKYVLFLLVGIGLFCAWMLWNKPDASYQDCLRYAESAGVQFTYADNVCILTGDAQ